MTVFVDTSAFYALLDADDAGHPAVRAAFEDLLARRKPLLTTSYVVVETAALLQHRIGVPPVRAFHERLLGVCDVVWVDERLHEIAYRALSVAGRRAVSLVDWVSFETMRRHGVETALALDGDFTSQGFTVVPDAVG